jgi:hypothetical protein
MRFRDTVVFVTESVGFIGSAVVRARQSRLGGSASRQGHHAVTGAAH